MISLNKSIYEMKRLKKILENKMEHTFLWEKIEKPEIDEDKLFILSKIVPKNPPQSRENRDVYIVTTMLVQTALDSHELVNDDAPDETNEEKLTRQLHVLAGDYYSGLYYYLLSEMEDIAFIHTLAVAIKQINELKMKLYYHEYENFDEFIHLKVAIESLLFEKAAAYFNQPGFADSFQQWLYVRTIIRDKKRILNDEILLNGVMDAKTKSAYLTAEDKLRSLIHREWFVFQNKLNELPHSILEIKSYFNRKRMACTSMNTLNVEEG